MSQLITALRSGTKKVTTAGTRVQLADTSANPQPVTLAVCVQALGTNTGNVVVGDANVVALPGTQGSPLQRGILLTQNATITIGVTDIGQIWVDSVTSGDGVSWVAGAA